MASFRASSLVPPGFVVQDIVCDQTSILIHHERSFSNCPSCGTPSQRVHSRYRRSAMDLPLYGRRARLTVMARRFRYTAPLCARRMFAECFPDEALAPWARRTARLEALVHHLGLTLGALRGDLRPSQLDQQGQSAGANGKRARPAKSIPFARDCRSQDLVRADSIKQ